VAFPVRKLVPLVLFAAGLLLAVSAPASAAEYDLRSGGNVTINGGLFYTDEQHPTGTGFIDSFLRIQQNGWEQGYNTSARPVEDSVQVKVDPNFTRNLTLGEVGTKTIGGVLYREFFLDVNEPAGAGNKNWITLDQLEIYGSNMANLNQYCGGTANTGSGDLGDQASGNTTCGTTNANYNNDATKLYDLDTGANNFVQLDYLLKGNGSGSSDMAFYLRDSLFTGYGYVYLFSQFGDLSLNKNNNLYESQAGFEEWFTKSPTIPPPNIQSMPEPATLVLLGSGLALVWRRRRRSA
jgi:hypothetical protein